MQVKSAKAKARRLQNWTRDKILAAFHPFIHAEDITCALMGETGADVKLTRAARHLFPFKIECKAQKNGFTAIYNAMAQCTNHAGTGEPIVFIRQDRQKALAIVDAEYFITRMGRQ